MKWLARALVVILPLHAAPVVGGEGACVRWDLLHPDRYAADPTTLAAAWVPVIERLYEAIPFLSPKEERWLEEELVSVRVARAMRSREYALRQAKGNAGGLLGLARRLTEKRDRAAQARDWLWFAYALIDPDDALYLARLEAEGVIQRGAIPRNWKWGRRGRAALLSKKLSDGDAHNWPSMSLAAPSRPS